MIKNISLLSLFFVYSSNFCMNFSKVCFDNNPTIQMYTGALNNGGTLVAYFQKEGPKQGQYFASLIDAYRRRQNFTNIQAQNYYTMLEEQYNTQMDI